MVEQVFVFRAGLVGGDDGELRQLQVPERERLAGGEFVHGGQLGRSGVAEGLQQASLKLAEEAPALGGLTRALHLAAQGKPLLRPGLQALVGGTVAVIAGFVGLAGFSSFPGIEPGLDVALEDLGQVVVAVKLVFVGDAGEGLNGVEYGHGGQTPATAAVELGLQTAAST